MKEVEEIASGASGIFGLYVCHGGVNDFVFRHVFFVCVLKDWIGGGWICTQYFFLLLLDMKGGKGSNIFMGISK